MKPNILLITADDLNFTSTGVFGCKVDDITPNIDKLAKEGMTFDYAHVSVSVCQPSRQVLMTGRYPHRNGALGFSPIAEDVPTLQERLRANGYINGIISKTKHIQPLHKYCWDFCIECYNPENGWGRNPEVYFQHSRAFFIKAKEEKKPFFLMANSNDPHRPFAGSAKEIVKFGGNLPAERTYHPGEVEVPGFLPDIEGVRKEIAEYYTSVHRCDKTVGAILSALDDSGMADNTLVMFLSDNGMSQPFAKANCYQNSTKTPWIVRWPNTTEPNSWDKDHMISGVDFMPTILEAAGISQVEGVDGRSFLPLLRGEKQEGRDKVYTIFNLTSAHKSYPMRCLRSKRYGYLFNAWSDGECQYTNEAAMGKGFAAMKEASSENSEISARVNYFTYRTQEEFYDYEADPEGLTNLIQAKEWQAEINRHKRLMLTEMEKTGDPLLEQFQVLLK